MRPEQLKIMSLVVMVLQTTALVLTLRYSRTAATDGPRYISSTAVVVSEVVKLFTALLMVTGQQNWSIPRTISQLYEEVWLEPMDCLKVSVPAIAYVIQNNLLFLALSKLDAATYQVTYQLKILTTALFSVTMLNKNLNKTKWASLILLMIGVACVQVPASPSSTTAANPTADSATSDANLSDRLIGLIAVVAACFTSGFSGVYLERILKQSPVSAWVRNFELAFFSIFGGLLTVGLYDIRMVRAEGFFQGYDMITWAVIFQQAFAGLVIAFVMKYADNILKGFAASVSIVLSSVISYFVLTDLQLSILFVFGTTTVIGSVFLYNIDFSIMRQPIAVKKSRVAADSDGCVVGVSDNGGLNQWKYFSTAVNVFDEPAPPKEAFGWRPGEPDQLSRNHVYMRATGLETWSSDITRYWLCEYPETDAWAFKVAAKGMRGADNMLIQEKSNVRYAMECASVCSQTKLCHSYSFSEKLQKCRVHFYADATKNSVVDPDWKLYNLA